MNKLEALRCVEITSQRQADNGTISYFDPQTHAYYNLYENGYVRRSFGRKRLSDGSLSHETIYQLNPTEVGKVVVKRFNGSTYEPYEYDRKERIMLMTHEERVECAARAVINYRKTQKLINQN